MRHPVLLLFLFFWNVTSGLSAQPVPDTVKINFETFTTRDGLSQGFVLCIIQDKEGFMWFATKDGLNKYDGYHVTVYRHIPGDPYSLPDNFVTQIVEDDAGNLWVGTSSKGLCLFDKKMEKCYPVPLEMPSSELNNESIRILKYRKGKLMVSKSQNTLILDVSHLLNDIGNPEKFNSIKQMFNYNELQKSAKHKTPSYFPDITWIDDDEVWATFTDSIYTFKTADQGRSWKVLAYPASKFGMDGTSEFILAWSDTGHVIFCSNARLVVFDYKRNQVIHSIAFSNNNPSSCVAIRDMHNNLLLDNGGQYSFDTHRYTLTPVVSNPGLLRNCIPPGFIDRTGILWIGTNSSTGILKYDARKEKFHSYHFQNSSVYFQTTGDDIYFSNNGVNALFNYKTGKLIQPYGMLPRNLFDWNYKAQDRSGYCYSNVTEISTRKVAIYKSTLTNPNKGDLFYQGKSWGRKLIFDRDDALWGLLEGADFSRSIARYDKVTGIKTAVYRFPIKNDANEYLFISDSWQDANHVFWFATLQGLFSFNEKSKAWHQWKNIPADTTSLSSDMLFSICPDPKEPDKYLWIGSNGAGFNRFEFATGRCIRYSEKNGLPNNVVYGILSDDAGNLWMSTNKGLSCITPPPPGRATGGWVFRNFTESDGLQGDEFNRYQSLKLKSGELLFGGVNGLTIFNPSEVLIQNPAPNIVLTGFTVFNKPVDNKSDNSIMSADIGYAKTITLPYNKNMFAFEFAALESSPAEKKQYKYFLEGFNEEWIDNGSKNTESFTNLDPGEYTFHVTGANRDGVWSKNEASVIIHILPPWWGTWWFRALVLAMAALSIYSFYRYRLAQQMKLANMRNRIASDLHDEIGSTLSSISLYSEAAKRMLHGNESAEKVLTKINSNTSEMMEAMSDIVWAINTRNDKFDNLVNRMRSFAVQVSEAKNFELHMAENIDMPNMPLDMYERKNLYLVFKEAVNNAAKYSACQNLWIEFSNKNNLLEMKIKDDGVGFSPLTFENVTGTRQGGNGIANMKKRADDIKSNLKIISEPGQGTEIVIRINLK